MANIELYNPAMQTEIEACFKVCIDALGWEYQPSNRHSDILDIENIYMQHGRFWGLFGNGKLVGMVAVRRIDEKGKVAEMKRLYILPKYQGKGYGGMLFKHALDYAKTEGYMALRADTRHDRTASLHLIERYGFRQIERYNQNKFAELYFEFDLTKYESEAQLCP